MDLQGLSGRRTDYLRRAEGSVTFGPAARTMGGKFGATEIILIAVVILLFFGGKKIPELMRGLGRGMKEFKDAKDGTGPKDEK